MDNRRFVFKDFLEEMRSDLIDFEKESVPEIRKAIINSVISRFEIISSKRNKFNDNTVSLPLMGLILPDLFLRAKNASTKALESEAIGKAISHLDEMIKEAHRNGV